MGAHRDRANTTMGIFGRAGNRDRRSGQSGRSRGIQNRRPHYAHQRRIHSRAGRSASFWCGDTRTANSVDCDPQWNSDHSRADTRGAAAPIVRQAKPSIHGTTERRRRRSMERRGRDGSARRRHNGHQRRRLDGSTKGNHTCSVPLETRFSKVAYSLASSRYRKNDCVARDIDSSQRG